MSALVLSLNPWCINKLNWNVQMLKMICLVTHCQYEPWARMAGVVKSSGLGSDPDLWDYQSPPLEKMRVIIIIIIVPTF